MVTCPRPGCGKTLVRGIGCIDHGEPAFVLAEEAAARLKAERQKKRPSHRWTAEHWAFIVEHADTLSQSAIARALTKKFGIKRSLRSVKHVMERRGLHKQPVPATARTAPKQARHWSERPAGTWWSDDEIEGIEDGKLKLLYRRRSPAAVKVKASRVGIPLRSGDGAMSVRQVAERWRIHPNVVLEWVKRKLLPARRNGRLWRIDPEVAEVYVPALRGLARAASGAGRGWWSAPSVAAELAECQEKVRAMPLLVDAILRDGLVRSDGDEDDAEEWD